MSMDSANALKIKQVGLQINQKIDYLAKTFARGREEDLGGSIYSKGDIQEMKFKSDQRLNSLQTYCLSKHDAWQNIQSTVKDVLFYNKSNLKDVYDLLLYIRGFRNTEVVGMCEKLSSKLKRREIENILRELSLQDVIVSQIRLNLNLSGTLM